jgi:hypothetical protein
MSNAYLKFASQFSNLNPYDLKHLSECILCKIEDGFNEKLCGCNSKAALTEKDIKYAVTEAMQEILLELKQQELRMERMRFDQTKTKMFASKKIAA